MKTVYYRTTPKLNDNLPLWKYLRYENYKMIYIEDNKNQEIMFHI